MIRDYLARLRLAWRVYSLCGYPILARAIWSAHYAVGVYP